MNKNDVDFIRKEAKGCFQIFDSISDDKLFDIIGKMLPNLTIHRFYYVDGFTNDKRIILSDNKMLYSIAVDDSTLELCSISLNDISKVLINSAFSEDFIKYDLYADGNTNDYSIRIRLYESNNGLKEFLDRIVCGEFRSD